MSLFYDKNHSSMKYYLIAGEASGDLHASRLMQELKEKDPNAEFRFFGGDLMQAQGGELVKHYKNMAYMGFVQVIKHLPEILSNMSSCKRDILSFKPDILILIDYPSFNLKIAEFVKKELGIPVVYYISPKLWAWKEYRVKAIKKYVDCMLSILPFEVEFYKKHNYEVTYVGNPTVDELMPMINNHTWIKAEEFIKENNLDSRPIVTLMAGSRKAEVKGNLPLMLEVINKYPQYQPVIAGAPGLDVDFYEPYLKNGVKIVFGKTHQLLLNSYAAMVTSGTATLETAVMNVPQVVCYQLGGGKLFYNIMEKVLKIDYVSLVNLIANAPVVKELLSYKFTPESLDKEFKNITENKDYRQEMIENYQIVRDRLGETGAPRKGAEIIVERYLNKNK